MSASLTLLNISDIRGEFALVVVLSQLQLFSWEGPSLHLRDFALLLKSAVPHALLAEEFSECS